MELLICYLKKFKGQQGLYIIRPKNKDLLKQICKKISYEFTSDIAYIGKSKNLFTRGKEEMGWSNFEGATFVRKIGVYLELDIKDKRNKVLRDQSRSFICSNFEIECIPFDNQINILEEETKYIKSLRPCMNDNKK